MEQTTVFSSTRMKDFIPIRDRNGSQMAFMLFRASTIKTHFTGTTKHLTRVRFRAPSSMNFTWGHSRLKAPWMQPLRNLNTCAILVSLTWNCCPLDLLKVTMDGAMTEFRSL